MGADMSKPGSRRWASRIALPLVAVLAASMAGAAGASAKPPWTGTAVQDVAPVATSDLRQVDRPNWTAEARAVRGPRQVRWPAAGVSRLDLSTSVGVADPAVAKARAASVAVVPVSLSNVAGEDVLDGSRGLPGVQTATVTIFDQATSRRAGITGVMLAVGRADGRARQDKVTVDVDYSGFATAAGGDWSSRLRLVQLPACVLSTPERPECQTVTPLRSKNDVKASTVSAQAPVSGGVTVLSVQAGPSGDNGDYTATSLSAAGTWNVGTQTGDFTWSYPLRMPPSLGGPTPSLAMGYSSGSVDGRTGTSNNQGGWIGDGWDMWPGFIERKYASCADDNPAHKTGDQCWSSSNATLSLSGHAGELIETGTPNVWRLKSDDGTRIEKFIDAARGNGDNDNEYWKVTTTDGTQYFFGYHKLPNWAGGNAVTDSVWTVPVAGNNPGEPCYNSTFGNAFCDQAWRWNLDYVVDPHDNSMALFYSKETGWYGKDNTASLRTAYTRGGWLDRIEYGTRKGTEYGSAAPMKVVFGTAERCLSGCWAGTPWASDPVPAAWLDTPWDQNCATAPCTDKTAPTFWSARRLSTITTQVRSGQASYRDVESWTLRHEFLNAGDNEGFPMWLRGITHRGLVTTAGGAATTEPEIVFDPGSEPLPNRVDGPADGRLSLTRFRIKNITTESGGQIAIAYSGPDCTKTTLPVPESNTRRCMPAFYSPAGTPTLDWFHKYVITSVTLLDPQYVNEFGAVVSPNDPQYTFYDYLDGAAWHYTDDELTKPEFKTWGDWRGYARVQVRSGDVGGPHTATEYRYLRGMDGDKQPTGTRDVWLPDSWGGSIEDHEALNGFVRQQITFNGAGGPEVASTLNDPWKFGPTATYTRNGVTVNAWKTATDTSRTRTALAAGGFRTTKTSTAYNTDGFPITVDTFGTEAVDGDETCTRTLYARNDTIWMIGKVSQTETLSGTCVAATIPAAASTVLARQRTFYDTYVDDGSLGAAPTKGDPVRGEQLESWTSSTPHYRALAVNTFDGHGRVTSIQDARGNISTTGYTIDAATGLVTSVTDTNPLNHQIVTVKEPAWDLPTKVTDPNGALTDMTYDGMGRMTAVWLPGRNKASQTASAKFTYLIRSSGGPTAVTTETLTPQATYRKSVNLFDGFLRQRQNQTQATGGGRQVTETLHNGRGQVKWTSAAHYTTGTASTTLTHASGQIPAITQYEYDGAGRTTADIFLANGAEKWRTTTSYGGDRTHATPPAGGTPTTTITDAFGQTTALRQYRNLADVGSTDPAKYIQTSYSHTLLGQLKTITDQPGNLWSYNYDLRGRQTQAVDPDKGTSTSTYDETGNVQTVTAPVGAGTATLAFTYDALGRKTSMRDDTITGALRAQWVYDTLQYGKGKLTSSTRYSAGLAYTTRTNTFDQYGRPTSTSVVMPSAETTLCAAAAPDTCTYTTTITYRPNGAPSTMTLPAAADLPSEKLTFGYSDVGNPNGFYSAAQIYVNGSSYNKFDQLLSRILGSGAFTGTLAEVQHLFTYDEPTRRMTTATVNTETATTPVNNSFTYDPAGNITKISDTAIGQTADHQCFTYDGLRRLTNAWTPAGGDCTPAPTTGGLGGPAPYWHQWSIDDTGTRTSETQHATAGDTTYSYTHPTYGASSVRPHTVTDVTATGPGLSWTRGFTYDNAGNTKTRTNAAGDLQTLTYDREGHLDTLVQGSATTRHVYTADGERLIRTDPDGTKTLYLGGTEIRGVGTVKTATRYYSHNGVTIASRTAAGLHWILGDHHGTAELTINAVGLATAKKRNLPYGKQRGTTTGTWAAGMDKGFVGGTQDPTELTHLGAREYEPLLGRFISVDPEMDQYDPQTLHGYLYSNNNPITYTDPTGRNWFTSAVKGVAKGWVAVNSAPVQTLSDFTKAQLHYANAVINDDMSMQDAYVGYTTYTTVAAVEAAASPITTVADGIDQTEQAIEAAGHGDWEGAAEHGYMASADAAYTAAFVFGAGQAAGARFGGCVRNSFVAGTQILMVDGGFKPIEKVMAGDSVLATDPVTGQTEAKQVTTTIVGHGEKHLVEVEVEDRSQGTATVTATDRHPIWVSNRGENGEWVDTAT